MAIDIEIDGQTGVVDQEICTARTSESGNIRAGRIERAAAGIAQGIDGQSIDNMRPAGDGQIESAGCCIIALHAPGGLAGRGNRPQIGKYVPRGDGAAGKGQIDIAADAVAANQSGTIAGRLQALRSESPGVEKC